MNNIDETKRSLIDQIARCLEVKGLDNYEKAGGIRGETFIDTLRWLPVENLEKMLGCNLDGCKSFEEAYQAYGRAGVFRFKPYIVPQDENENPTLCVRRNRFVHMFRGHHFQASETVDGIYDCESGAYRTNFLTNCNYCDEMLKEGLISYLLWWSAFISVGFTFDNVRELFETDRKVLEDFMEHSMRYWGAARDQHWEDIDKYITWSTGKIDYMERAMYQLADDNTSGKAAAYFAFGKKSVQVELPGHKLFTIAIPDLNEGVGRNLDNEWDLEEHEAEVEVLEKNHYIEMLVTMAIFMCGYKISFINWYAIGAHKMALMQPLRIPGVTNVVSLNDIYGKEPDEF